MIFIPSTDQTYTSATSYLDLNEANKIISSNADPSQWNNLTDEIKKFILNQASLSIDGLFSYQHRKTDENQMLKFPRNGLVSIPKSIKYAVCSLCLDISKNEAFKNVKSESIGRMSWQFFKNFNGATDEVMSYLRPLKMKGVKID